MLANNRYKTLTVNSNFEAELKKKTIQTFCTFIPVIIPELRPNSITIQFILHWYIVTHLYVTLHFSS
jgi:hypothetical protein